MVFPSTDYEVHFLSKFKDKIEFSLVFFLHCRNSENMFFVSFVLYLQAFWMIWTIWVVLIVRASKIISRYIRLHLHKARGKVLNTIYACAKRLGAQLLSRAQLLLILAMTGLQLSEGSWTQYAWVFQAIRSCPNGSQT